MEPCLWLFLVFLVFLLLMILLWMSVPQSPPLAETLAWVARHFEGWLRLIAFVFSLVLRKEGLAAVLIAVSVSGFGCLAAICSGWNAEMLRVIANFILRLLGRPLIPPGA